MAPPSETKTQILDTAERLFARHGIDAVGIRSVVEEAGVNLAAVHYHFGNREELVREVLKRRVEPMNAERLRLLDAVEAAAGTRAPNLEDVLRAFITPVFELIDRHPHLGWLLAHVDVTPEAKLRMFFYSLFVELVWRFGAALRRSVPGGLSEAEAYTRVQFTWGAMLFVMAKRGDPQMTAGGRLQSLPVDALVEQWIAFCAAGLRCPNPRRLGDRRPSASKGNGRTRAASRPPDEVSTVQSPHGGGVSENES